MPQNPSQPTNPAAGTSIVRYQGLSEDDIDRVVVEASAATSDRWDPPQGESALRVLPARIGERVVLLTFTHYAKIPGLEKGVFCNCPRLMEARPCPLCEMFTKLSGANKKHERDLAYEVYRPKPSGMCNIIVRGQERKGIQRWSLSKARMDDLRTLRRSKGGGDYTNPTEKGFDLLLNRTGTKLDTEYTLGADRQCSPLVANEDGVYDEEKALWLINNQPDLRIYLVTPTYEEVTAMMRGERVQRGGGTSDERQPYNPPARTVGDSVDDQRGGPVQGPGPEDMPF